MSVPRSVAVPALVEQLPISELAELAAELFGRGAASGQVLDALVKVADGLVDWSKVIPGPAGVAVEAFDAVLLRKVLKVVVAQASIRHRKAA